MAGISFDEGIGIVGLATSLLFSLIVWLFFGELGAELDDRNLCALLAFVACGFGWVFLDLELSYVEKTEHRTSTSGTRSGTFQST